MDLPPVAKNILRGLLEKGGPRVHAALAIVCGATSCGVLVLFAVARVKGISVQTEYLATLGVFNTVVYLIWKTGKAGEDGSQEAPAPPPPSGAQP